MASMALKERVYPCRSDGKDEDSDLSHLALDFVNNDF